MKIQKKEGQRIFVESDSGKVYECNLMTLKCTCPHFVFRLNNSGGLCKHLEWLTNNINKKEDGEIEKMFIDFLKNYPFGYSVTDFIYEMQEECDNALEVVDNMKRKFMILEKNGMFYLI